MNKKLLIMIAASVAILALVVAWVAVRNGNDDPAQVQSPTHDTTQGPETTAPTASLPPQETQVIETTEEPRVPDTTEPSEAPTRPQGGNEDDPSGVTGPEKPKNLQFPYAIPGTSLVIEKIDSYDGIFLEDGSDMAVTGITAMVLTNAGDTCAELAMINLTQGDNILQFKVSALGAGCTVVVQELTAAKYQETPVTDCTADVAELDHLEMSAGVVEIKENENGSLTVTNLTEETIPCVRVFYKFCMESASVYVGGITYTAKIVDLKPGAPQEISPSHYAAGYSEVIMVRTYETAD